MATSALSELLQPAKGYDHNDPSLKTGEGGLTVWVLQKMAQEQRFKELDDLFDNGLNMNALPVGMCAGTGVATLDVKPKFIDEKIVNEMDEWFRRKELAGQDILLVEQ